MAIAAPFPSVRATSARTRQTAPIRLTRRGRVVLGLLTSIVALAALAATGPQADAAEQLGAKAGQATVVVRPGDTVWSIARELDPAADPRVLVARIRELNDLDSAVVVTGQALVVPRIGG